MRNKRNVQKVEDNKFNRSKLVVLRQQTKESAGEETARLKKEVQELRIAGAGLARCFEDMLGSQYEGDIPELERMKALIGKLN